MNSPRDLIAVTAAMCLALLALAWDAAPSNPPLFHAEENRHD